MCDEMPEFCTVSDVRARKTHRCCECRGQIFSGDIYERQSGKIDGYMFSETTCIRCRNIRNEVALVSDKVIGDACYIFGQLREAVYELATWSDEAAELLSAIPGIAPFMPENLRKQNTANPLGGSARSGEGL